METVPGFGSRTARIVIIGEAPAREEIRYRRPFAGRAGKELAKLLRDAGLYKGDRDTPIVTEEGLQAASIYITNASLQPVQGNKEDFFFERNGKPTLTFLEGMSALGKDLQEIKPNVVVPMGNYALWAMMQFQGIMRQRGSIFRSPLWGVKVIPTIHPAAILHGAKDEGEGFTGMWRYRPVIILDLLCIKEQSKFPELKLRKRELVVLHDLDTGEAKDAIDRLRHAKGLIWDIETFGGMDLACVGFSDWDPEWGVCIPYEKDPRRLAIYKELLETDVPKGGQNLMFDVTLMDQLGVHARNIVHDTMIAAHTLCPDLPKGLDFLTSILTDIPYYKDEGKEWKRKKNLQQFWEYNCKDNCAEAEIAVRQREELLEDNDLWRTFQRKMALFEPFRWQTYEGARLDRDRFAALSKEATEKADRFQKELDVAAGGHFNVRSPPQIRKLIYEDRGHPIRTRKKKVTTKAEVLLDIAAKTQDRVPLLVVRTREQKKLLSNYYTPNIISPDGRLRTLCNIVGTKTGRRSNSKPLWGNGLNFQNIPDNSRGMVIADEGYELGHFDQMQAEAVVTAYYALDPIHMDCFRTGKDVHRVTACLLLDRPVEDWTQIEKDSTMRDVAKHCNHALNYGMGPVTFMYTVNKFWDPDEKDSLFIGEDLAYSLWEKYRKVRPALESYWESVRYELRNNQMTLTTPHGNRRQFLDRWSDGLLMDAYSWKPQTIVGENTSIAISRIYGDKELREAGVKFLTETHDSTTWQWPKGARDSVVPKIMKHSEVELLINGYRLVIPIEGSVGDRWLKEEMDDLGVSRKTAEINADTEN